jgi:hypothetical protein
VELLTLAILSSNQFFMKESLAFKTIVKALDTLHAPTFGVIMLYCFIICNSPLCALGGNVPLKCTSFFASLDVVLEQQQQSKCSVTDGTEGAVIGGDLH